MEYFVVGLIGFTFGVLIFGGMWSAEKQKRIRAEAMINKLKKDLVTLSNWK